MDRQEPERRGSRGPAEATTPAGPGWRAAETVDAPGEAGGVNLEEDCGGPAPASLV
jgi:hypothetical protein